MRIISFYTVLLVISFAIQKISAQEEDETLQFKIEQLERKKSDVTNVEKDALKAEVEFVNEQLAKGKISQEEAQELKKEYAENHAKNIENKLAILDNQIALLKRNGEIDLNTESSQVEIGFNSENNGDRLFGIRYNSGNQNKTIFDKRTHSDIVMAFGLNNESNGNAFSESPFKLTGSRFFEIGYAWNTRVFKNSNWLRLKYGISFQFNGFKPNNKEVFVKSNDPTVDSNALFLVDAKEVFEIDKELEKSKLRMDSFIFPIHFEFGPSEKKVNGKYVRYDTNKKFKFGIGGYIGINYNNVQKTKWPKDVEFLGINPDYSLWAGGNQSTVKGLSAYAGFDDISLYFKFETSSSIRRLVNQNVISLGLRFDL
ncbi:MAG: hypothetical protein WBM98_01140 [Maribacter sp.]|uniref:coiled-coil domain-containing protein n=1 Tax=Maribacter sp. TaxID=1897614 RepID=UPI003C70F26E